MLRGRDVVDQSFVYSLFPFLFTAALFLLSGCGSGGKAGSGFSQNGFLSISSEPAGALIFLNGQSTNRVTPATLSLPAGTYRIRLENGQDERWEGDVIIQQGNTTTVNIKLEQIFVPEIPFRHIPSFHCSVLFPPS